MTIPESETYKWLRGIAQEQASVLKDYVHIEASVSSSHQLIGDNPYIDFQFEVTNRCVYGISLSGDLTGSISFGNKRLSKAPKLEPHNIRKLPLNGVGWFVVSQPLTPSEAAEILTDVPGQFQLYGLHATIIGSPGLAEPVDIDWGNGPIISKEFIDSNYPKLDIRITPLPLHTYFGRRANSDYPHDPLGTVLSLQVCFRNPRPLRVRQFKLVTSSPHIAAEAGEIKDRPHRDANGSLVPFGTDLSPNLANQNIDVNRDNITDGWLQFIVRDVPPPKMLSPADFVVRLHIVDESGEEHRQDVTGLTYTRKYFNSNTNNG